MVMIPTDADIFLRGLEKDYERAGENEAMFFIRKLSDLKNNTAELSEPQKQRISETLHEMVKIGLFDKPKKNSDLSPVRTQILFSMATFINSCRE